MPKGSTKGSFTGLDVLIGGLDSMVESAMAQVAENAAKAARAHAKGHLADMVEIVTPAKGFRAIQPTKEAYYGKWMENGRAGFAPKGAFTKAGRVRKIRGGVAAAKVLSFEKNGVRFFVRRVGPEKAEPYMVFAQKYLETQGAKDMQRLLDSKVTK